jgi:hypothetical protein
MRYRAYFAPADTARCCQSHKIVEDRSSAWKIVRLVAGSDSSDSPLPPPACLHHHTATKNRLAFTSVQNFGISQAWGQACSVFGSIEALARTRSHRCATRRRQNPISRWDAAGNDTNRVPRALTLGDILLGDTGRCRGKYCDDTGQWEVVALEKAKGAKEKVKVSNWGWVPWKYIKPIRLSSCGIAGRLPPHSAG